MLLMATHPEAAGIPWAMVGFYGMGVLGANLALFFLFLGKTERAISVGQCVARKAAGTMIGMCMSWVWITGQWWMLELFSDQIPQKITELGPIHVDALSSIAVGFALQWFVVQPRIVNKYFEKRK